ncbi:MAG: hypothetical protein D6704_08140 [Nitrospirae bacterium]|nr:MAG: hypothetical protein D6704_08140 [Nitrospirota bacterium]
MNMVLSSTKLNHHGEPVKDAVMLRLWPRVARMVVVSLLVMGFLFSCVRMEGGSAPVPGWHSQAAAQENRVHMPMAEGRQGPSLSLVPHSSPQSSQALERADQRLDRRTQKKLLLVLLLLGAAAEKHR